MTDLPANGRLDGPVGIITGALKGIGAATAVEFARGGARLMLIARSLADGDALAEKVRVAGGKAIFESCDVRDFAGVERVVERTVAEFGRIDFLVANAGIADQSLVSDGDPERWRAVVETNILGVLYSTRAVLPRMLAQDSGHIFVMSSVSGREPYVGEPVYIATKWAQVGFVHALRLELLDQGSNVRVTIVEPGLVDTPLTRGNPRSKPLFEQAQPLTPEEVASAVVYAYSQPRNVLVSEITVRPLHQKLPSGLM